MRSHFPEILHGICDHLQQHKDALKNASRVNKIWAEQGLNAIWRKRGRGAANPVGCHAPFTDVNSTPIRIHYWRLGQYHLENDSMFKHLTLTLANILFFIIFFLHTAPVLQKPLRKIVLRLSTFEYMDPNSNLALRLRMLLRVCCIRENCPFPTLSDFMEELVFDGDDDDDEEEEDGSTALYICHVRSLDIGSVCIIHFRTIGTDL
jgi:hypothetical protein